MVKHITKEEAAKAVRERAFTITDQDSSDFGRTIIHSFLGMFGADNDLDSALENISKADEIAWTDDMFGHDLAVKVGDKVWRYDIKQN